MPFKLTPFVLCLQCISVVAFSATSFLSTPSVRLIPNSLRATVRGHVKRDALLGLSMKTKTLSRERKAGILKRSWEPTPAPTPLSQVLDAYSLPTVTAGADSSTGVSTKHGNQDSATILTNLPELDGATVVGVFDGHGPVGGNVAQHLARTLPRLLIDKTVTKMQGVPTTTAVASECLKDAFEKAEASLSTKVGLDSSGATATVAMVQGSRLALGWVGDSRAVIGGHVQGGIGAMAAGNLPYGIKGGVHVEALTHDHDTSNKGELLRIITKGGEIRNREMSFGTGRYIFYRGAEYPGLAVTRALGDFNGKRSSGPLLSAEPEVATRQLRSTDEVLVVASDGLWRYVSDAEAVQAALPYLESRDAASAAKHLTALAKERWLQHGKYADDITAVVTFL